MRFLYKIYSGYDGFTPKDIPRRLEDGRLRLGWHRFVDDVREGDEVWVYFWGPGTKRPGIYVFGEVIDVDALDERVFIGLREWSQDHSITPDDLVDRVRQAVRARGIQVFPFPDLWPEKTLNCNIGTYATTCAERLCTTCAQWRRFVLVEEGTFRKPLWLPPELLGLYPAYWVIPARSFAYYGGRNIRSHIVHMTEVWRRFKWGNLNLAYPLALGMWRVLKRDRAASFDFIVPIPLSPEKGPSKHRTLALSRELSRLLNVPTVQALELSEPTSKRELMKTMSAETFENVYASRLRLAQPIAEGTRLLLVDDVVTAGHTLRACVKWLQSAVSGVRAAAATPGIMVIDHNVVDRQVIWAPPPTSSSTQVEPNPVSR